MVKSCSRAGVFVFALILFACGVKNAYGAGSKDEYIAQNVSGDACDDRLSGDREHTAENRAVDKAGLSAVKLSGVIQRNFPNLSANAIDIISYRIIDEYMVNMAHAVKYSDNNRVCVKLSADIEMTMADLAKLVAEYKDSDSPLEQIGKAVEVAQAAEQVMQNTTLKPQSLSDKKLIGIRKMIFWNGVETDYYQDLLADLFAKSEYFYVTKDESVADYMITPRLIKSQVDELEAGNHKMSMFVELEADSLTNDDFVSLKETQNHFILYAGDKDEQKIADDLLRKLLIKSAKEISRKMDSRLAAQLEKEKIR